MGSYVPLELPLRPSEASALAELIIRSLEERALTDDARNRLSGEAGTLGLASIRPYFGSLEADPIHNSVYYLAADGLSAELPQPLLLRLAPSSSPGSALFPDSVLIGRMRPGGGREIVVNAVPFASRDRATLATYAEKVSRAFLPRPQGALPAIATGNRHPEVSLPAAFTAFRSIFKSTGVNMASTVQLSATREMTTDEALVARDGSDPTAAGHTRVSIQALYHCGLWAAIRSGWREGYTAEADHVIITGNSDDEIARSLERGKEAIREAANYTKFTTDTSRLFELRADPRHPQPWSSAEVEERFTRIFTGEDQKWILAEFTGGSDVGGQRYELSAEEVRRLAVKFGRSLLLNEELYDFIRSVKASCSGNRGFDFEPSIDEAETLTTPREMLFYMQWLKSRGRAAQLVPPNLGFKKRQAYPETMDGPAGLNAYAAHKAWPELCRRVQQEYGGKPLEELGARVRELASIARHFNGTLSIHSGSGKQAAVLEQIGQATAGRVNYKISGELQLQLFDVLSEQHDDSPWRQLYLRMVQQANQFAAKGAFGSESELAAEYSEPYLGNADHGRVDGNLFLVFWLGNLVGSPDTDDLFFKDKLDQLPPHLVVEVQRRNTAYITWLASCLR